VKVLLIHPPAQNMIRTNVPEEVDEETGCYPPLGLLYVAAYALAHTKHTIEILDCQLDGLSYDDIEAEVRRRSPDLVGIQTMTFTLIDSIETARRVKAANPAIHVTLGGPHVYLFPEESIRLSEVDSLILGEGEMNFADFLNALDAGSDLATVKGLVWKKNGNVLRNPLRDLVCDLDALPFPARELLPINPYRSVLAQRTPITTLMSSRGCPSKCIFCDRPHLGKTFRARSPRNVVDEMQECSRLGIGEIFFYDDTFSVERERVSAICDLIVERKLTIGWDIRARVNDLTPELLAKLKRAGCQRIHYGIESGTPEIIRVLRKGVNLQHAREVFRATKKAGITTLAYFMLGNPTETREQIMKTIAYALTLDADYIHCSLTTPFPGTELYRMGLAQGLYPNDYWREFAAHPARDFVPRLWEENLTRNELLELLAYAYKRFYSRPSYILKRLFEVRSWSELKRKARAGLRILRI
jgi:anaerobic magnesium-protoporphyrin IX monomethyl ester cyclase